jgi:glycosyltransferase involved in cell wall biosynthesis
MSGRAHILCVAHSITCHDPHYNPTDAFVNTALYLARLLTQRGGYEVYMYAVEGSKCPGVKEVVEVVSGDTYRRVYGRRDDSIVNTFSDTQADSWTEHNRRSAVEVLKRRLSERDLVLPMFGCAHKPCTDILQRQGMPCVVEPCVGHPGSYAPFRVYCSYAWLYTDMTSKGYHRVQNYWSVVPHFLFPGDFPLGDGSGGYALYLGRIQEDKGVSLALQACRAANIPLKIVGNGTGVEGQAECLGVLGMEDKIKMLSRAAVVFVPTQYVEPFSYACLEAQFCGTPVLCTRWGGPSEIVLHGQTGFHCDTLQSFVDAVPLCMALDRASIRALAVQRFSDEAVCSEFCEYFTKVEDYCEGKSHFYTLGGTCKRPGWGMGRLTSGSSVSTSSASSSA